MKALLFAGALAASALAILPTVATAAPRGEAPLSAKVNYSDLDLSTAAGKARLNQRIKYAIRQVCQRPSSGDLRATADFNKCADQARAATQKGVALALNGPRGKARKA